MTTPFESAVFLTVRGKYIPPSLESMRTVHNATAGSDQGIALARSMGDLSHNVFAPLLKSKQAGAEAGEILFLDWWQDAKGLMDFFRNENIVQQGTKLFPSINANVWMPARGFFL